MFILKAQETDEVYDLPLANRREPAHASWVNRWYTCTCMYVCIYDMHIYAHVCIRVHVSGRRKKEMNVINIHLFFGCATWHLSWLGIKPMPPALGAQSLNHLTTREVLHGIFLNLNYIYIYVCVCVCVCKIYHVHKILSTEHIKGPKKCQYLLLNIESIFSKCKTPRN